MRTICKQCGGRLRKLGLESIYACDECEIFFTPKSVTLLIRSARNGYPYERIVTQGRKL